MKEIIIFDIDGCIVDYPRVFVDWINTNFKTGYSNISEIKINASKYKEFKHKYRLSGVKKNLTPFNGINTVFEFFSHDRFCIWIVTERPAIEPVMSDTKTFLIKEFPCYSELFFVDNKILFFKKLSLETKMNIKLIVEDEIDNILKINEILPDVKILYSNIQKRKETINLKNVCEIISWENFSERFGKDENFINSK